jgi:hypothetical protein
MDNRRKCAPWAGPPAPEAGAAWPFNPDIQGVPAICSIPAIQDIPDPAYTPNAHGRLSWPPASGNMKVNVNFHIKGSDRGMGGMVGHALLTGRMP